MWDTKVKKVRYYVLMIISFITLVLFIGGYNFVIKPTTNNKQNTMEQNLNNEKLDPSDATFSNNDTTEDDKLTSQTNALDKVMYLTFDDGPSDYTMQIVDILNHYKIKGTFYFIGNNVAGYEDSVKYAAENGHTVGLHSMTHNKQNIYKEDDPESFVNELYDVQNLLEPLIGYKTFSTRAPYGSNHMPITSFEKAGEAGFKMWDWSIDTNDWQEGVTAQSIMAFLTSYPAENREILLEHELPVTLEVLPQIIEFYQNEGYQFKSHDISSHFSYNFFRDKRY